MADVGRNVSGAGDFPSDERPAPFSSTGFLIMLVAMAAEAVVLYVLLKPSPIALVTDVKPGEAAPTATALELLAPTVTVPEVVASVPMREDATELRTVIISVAIKLGKAEGRTEEELDLRYLEKIYVPRVKALIPRLRHELIKIASEQYFAELRKSETQELILEKLKEGLNEELKKHGIEPRIQKLYWDAFHFD